MHVVQSLKDLAKEEDQIKYMINDTCSMLPCSPCMCPNVSLLTHDPWQGPQHECSHGYLR